MSEHNPAGASERAILGGGCFWCLEAVFRAMRGVRAVRSGYAGGQTESPTYRQVCSGDTGHAEVVEVEFDPAQVDYSTLLDVFFTVHDPTTLNRQGNDVGTQYRSVIFATTPAQLEVAHRRVAELNAENVFGRPVVTQVEAAPRFWPAEAEHHDYYARNGHEPYCQYVVAPKVAKLRARFPALCAAASG